MEKKIVGIFICMLLIATALPATGIMNIKTTWFINENKYLESNPNNPANSPDVITIKIVAKVTNVDDPDNLLGGAIKVNDKITGKYIYDSGTPDTDPDSHIGLYLHTSSTFGVELKAGGFVFKTNPSHVIFLIEIANDHYNIMDCYCIYSDDNLQLSNGIIVDRIQWGLLDSTHTALSNDALPTTAPDLSDWDINSLEIQGWDPQNPSKSYEIDATVTKATKSKARDVHFIIQPILLWLLEHFPNMFPILRHLMKL